MRGETLRDWLQAYVWVWPWRVWRWLTHPCAGCGRRFALRNHVLCLWRGRLYHEACVPGPMPVYGEDC